MSSATCEELMARPSLRDEYVRRRAAEIVLPEVMRWMIPCGDMITRERDAMRDLMQVADVHADGYHMARGLEARGWCVDAELTSILDGGWVRDALEELTRQWVRCLGVRPEFANGALVFARIAGREEQQGRIVGVDEHLAKYHVHYPDLRASHYLEVDFERCSAVKNEDCD